MDKDSPLQEEHFQQIRDGLEKLTQAERMIDQAIRAGVDVEGHKKQVGELRAQLLRLRQAYFPGRTA